MPVVSVSVNGGVPEPRTVGLRTPELRVGVLCDVLLDDGWELFVIERTTPTLCVKQLPGMDVRGPSGGTSRAESPLLTEPPLRRPGVQPKAVPELTSDVESRQ